MDSKALLHDHDPVDTSFLVLGNSIGGGPDPMRWNIPCVVFNHGMLGDIRVVVHSTAELRYSIVSAYRTSADDGVPLVIATEAAYYYRASERTKRVSLTVRKIINELKSPAMKRSVPLPRVITLNGYQVNRGLFGDGRPGCLADLEQERAEEIAGAKLGDGSILARAICTGHLLAHSQLGSLITPASYINRIEG